MKFDQHCASTWCRFTEVVTRVLLWERQREVSCDICGIVAQQMLNDAARDDLRISGGSPMPASPPGCNSSSHVFCHESWCLEQTGLFFMPCGIFLSHPFRNAYVCQVRLDLCPLSRYYKEYSCCAPNDVAHERAPERDARLPCSSAITCTSGGLEHCGCGRHACLIRLLPTGKP